MNKSKSSGICLYKVVEDTIFALAQISHNQKILWSTISDIVMCSIYTYTLTNVIKYGSALHSCIVDNLRIVVVWVMSVCFMGEHFNWIEMIGFIVFILVGSLVYNEIIIVPIKIFRPPKIVDKEHIHSH